MDNKRGQVTIFIIVAIIVVAAVVLFFTFRDTAQMIKLPVSIEPVYNTFLECLEEETEVGVSVLQSQAGYIELPEFEPGSRYMPFSSQLDFLGNPVPYWYYVSGNNLVREQAPSKAEMEKQLANYVEENARDCIFDRYYSQGFEILQDEPNARVSIKSNSVDVYLGMRMTIEQAGDRARITNHEISVDSKLGSLYDSAKKIYEHEQKEQFLEEYAVDILRLYAPVDGVEITCSPQIWGADEVFDELEEAIEANTLALKGKGAADDYFVVDLPAIGEDVRFINSKQWPHGFEVEPSEENILMATPIGNQQGLGILGFCYVPYHFIYDVRYPVLVQVYSGDEIFQFPMAVVIQANNPRESLEANASIVDVPEICDKANTPVQVNTYDTSLTPVETEIYYECFGDTCHIGQGPLEENFPQCINGYVIAKAEGYEDTRYLFSTVEGGNVEIIMDKLYDLGVRIKVDGQDYNGPTIVYFTSDKNSEVLSYPEQRTVHLSEEEYEIQLYIYKESSINLEATTKEQCIEVPRSGLGGFLGLTREKCFDVEIPSQIVSNVLAGGGRVSYYMLESELQGAEIIELSTESLPVPNSLEELQINYALYENRGLDVMIR